jgi:hypothetical protein
MYQIVLFNSAGCEIFRSDPLPAADDISLAQVVGVLESERMVFSVGDTLQFVEVIA